MKYLCVVFKDIFLNSAKIHKCVQGMRLNNVRIQNGKNFCISCPLDDGKKIQYRHVVIFYTEKLGGGKQSKEAPLNAASQHHQTTTLCTVMVPQALSLFSKMTSTVFSVHRHMLLRVTTIIRLALSYSPVHLCPCAGNQSQVVF